MPLQQNQYMQYPAIPGVPAGNSALQDSNNFNAYNPTTYGSGSIKTVSTVSPDFTNIFNRWLGSGIGQGAQPFDLSSFLPSTGQQTQPGQLAAPINPLLDALGNFFQNGQGGKMPGFNTLSEMSRSGMPTDVGPAWEAMKQAQQRNIDMGAANVREQLAGLGNLKSSTFGNAIGDYYEQAGKDQNALLAQMSLQSQESARGRQQGASELLFQGANQLGQLFQGLDQQSINATLQEFLRTRPEYGPLLNMMFSLATTFSPTTQQPKGGVLGAALGAAGPAMEGIASLAALCWVARAAYGEHDPRWRLVRNFIFMPRTREVAKLAVLYLLNGPRLALAMYKSPRLKNEVRGYLDDIIAFA